LPDMIGHSPIYTGARIDTRIGARIGALHADRTDGLHTVCGRDTGCTVCVFIMSGILDSCSHFERPCVRSVRP
jgi:hypothetical protein